MSNDMTRGAFLKALAALGLAPSALRRLEAEAEPDVHGGSLSGGEWEQYPEPVTRPAPSPPPENTAVLIAPDGERWDLDLLSVTAHRDPPDYIEVTAAAGERSYIAGLPSPEPASLEMEVKGMIGPSVMDHPDLTLSMNVSGTRFDATVAVTSLDRWYDAWGVPRSDLLLLLRGPLTMTAT